VRSTGAKKPPPPHFDEQANQSTPKVSKKEGQAGGAITVALPDSGMLDTIPKDELREIQTGSGDILYGDFEK
jgi:hypothetical protein